MRRRLAAGMAVGVLVLTVLAVQPAGATHGCDAPDCNPVVVALLEGQGKVCDLAEGWGDNPKCSFHNDPLWTGSLNVAQGLYCPTRGPGAGRLNAQGNPVEAPFSFNAPSGIQPPAPGLCVSNVGASNCSFDSKGQLAPGHPLGGDQETLGAYAFSSLGRGTSTFTAPGLVTKATFGWDQSAATILPLQGEVTESTPAGGAGATVVGFTSSRSFQDGGNCGIDQATPTKIFQVEGMIVTF